MGRDVAGECCMGRMMHRVGCYTRGWSKDREWCTEGDMVPGGMLHGGGAWGKVHRGILFP